MSVRLIRVSDTSHTTHHAEDVIVHGVHTDLSSGGTRNRAGRKDKLEDGIVNAGEVARTRGLVLLRAEGEGVHVDTGIGAAGVVLEGLDNIEVRSLTLREAVLAVELELGRDNGVLAPTVHVEGSLGENEGSGIRNVGSGGSSAIGAIETREGTGTPLLLSGKAILLEVSGALSAVGVGDELNATIKGTRHLEEAVGGNEGIGALGLGGATERVDRVGKGIDRVRVVEGLGTEALVEYLGGI